MENYTFDELRDLFHTQDWVERSHDWVAVLQDGRHLFLSPPDEYGGPYIWVWGFGRSADELPDDLRRVVLELYDMLNEEKQSRRHYERRRCGE